MSGVPGPVFVAIPIDCLYCVGEVKGGMGLGVTTKYSDMIKNKEDRNIY